MDVSSISIDPGETPVCICGGRKWIVRTRIESESPLVRVDRFSDIIRETPDPQLYQQSVTIECLDCSLAYQPQASIAAKLDLVGNEVQPVVEAYSEGSQKQLEDETWQEKPSGHEDSFGWPLQVVNEAEWTE